MEERDACVYSEALRFKARASGSNGFGVEIDGWSKRRDFGLMCSRLMNQKVYDMRKCLCNTPCLICKSSSLHMPCMLRNAQPIACPPSCPNLPLWTNLPMHPPSPIPLKPFISYRFSSSTSQSSSKSQIPSPTRPTIQPTPIKPLLTEKLPRSPRINARQIPIQSAFPAASYVGGGVGRGVVKVGVPFFEDEGCGACVGCGGGEGEHMYSMRG